jgi:hypothetical protein
LKTDPLTLRDKLFPGGFAVHAYFPPDKYRLAEVENLRQIEVGLKQQYDEARAQGTPSRSRSSGSSRGCGIGCSDRSWTAET